MTYAGFWKRLAAVLIDSFVLFCPLLFISFILMGVIVGFNPDSATQASKAQAEMNIAMRLIGGVLGWLYFAFMESSNQQATLGKMALGIRVTDTDGSRVSFARATGRHFAKFVSCIIVYIGFLMAAFTRKKQGLHDKMASCLVVNASEESIEHKEKNEWSDSGVKDDNNDEHTHI